MLLLIVNQFKKKTCFRNIWTCLEARNFQRSLQYANEFLDICAGKTGRRERESDTVRFSGIAATGTNIILESWQTNKPIARPQITIRLTWWHLWVSLCVYLTSQVLRLGWYCSAKNLLILPVLIMGQITSNFKNMKINLTVNYNLLSKSRWWCFWLLTAF